MGKIRNSTRICRSLWQHPRDSRADLAKRLKIDKSTITYEIARLIDEGVIVELPKDTVPGSGRNPIPLELSREYGCVLGISIQNGSCALAEVNLAGEVLYTQQIDMQVTKDNLISTIVGLYDRFISLRKPQQSRCLGVGIGVGGLISKNTDAICYSVPLGVTESFAFVSQISKSISVPVTLENNANCCAWARLSFPPICTERNFITILIEFQQALLDHPKYGGVGIGLGLVLNGKLYQGEHSFAGEFRSAFCRYGIGDGQLSIPRDKLAHILEDEAILESFTEELASNMAMLVNTLDVGEVFVRSDMDKEGKLFCSALRRAINVNWLFPVKKEVSISFTSLGPVSVAYGATGHLVTELFEKGTIPLE